jgi:hypothetical protein
MCTAYHIWIAGVFERALKGASDADFRQFIGHFLRPLATPAAHALQPQL